MKKFMEFLKRFFKELKKPYVPSKEYRMGQKAGAIRGARRHK